MKGFYIYGICQSQKIKKLSDQDRGEGIGRGKTFYIPYKDIEAIVSEVSLQEFGSKRDSKKSGRRFEVDKR